MGTDDPIEHGPRGSQPAADRMIYVMPEEYIRAFASQDMNFLEVWGILWRGKWLVILSTTLFAVASIVYALTTTQWFRAEVVLAPSDQSSARQLTGALGGLANLAGIGAGGDNSAEALAVLRSREFTASFIEGKNILPVLLAHRDDEASSGLDMRDAVKYFNDSVRSVSEDRDTQLVTLAIEWTDPNVAAEWANALVERLNDRMRQRALTEAQTNLEYLQDEFGKTNVVTLQQSIGRLMESELQKLMLARGNKEFAYKIIDPAQPPKLRSRPKRTLTVVLATLAGGIFGVVFAFLWHSLESEKRRARPTGK